MTDVTELDNAIAARLFGYRVDDEMVTRDPHTGEVVTWWRWFTQEGEEVETERFSASIGAAWEVVERLCEQGWLVTVQERLEGCPYLGTDFVLRPSRAVCRLRWWGAWDPGPGEACRRPEIEVDAESAPEAICLAALQAIERTGEITP